MTDKKIEDFGKGNVEGKGSEVTTLPETDLTEEELLQKKIEELRKRDPFIYK